MENGKGKNKKLAAQQQSVGRTNKRKKRKKQTTKRKKKEQYKEDSILVFAHFRLAVKIQNSLKLWKFAATVRQGWRNKRFDICNAKK